MGRDQIERNERNRQAKKAYLKSLANKVEDNVIGKFRARFAKTDSSFSRNCHFRDV